MQFRDNHSLKKLLTSKPVINIFKWLLVAMVVMLIIRHFYYHNQQGQQLLLGLRHLWESGKIAWLIIPLSMVVLNWSLEAIRWQLLSKKIEIIGFQKAFSAVLAGQSMGFVTPQGLGDYLGRIWHLEGKQRKEAVGSVMLGRWMQSIVTLLFGLIGIYFLLRNKWAFNSTLILSIYVIFLIVAIGGIFIFIAHRPNFISLTKSILGEKIASYIKVLSTYKVKQVVIIGLLTISRYVVFTCQFYLLLRIMGMDFPLMMIIGGISWMFLAKSVVPMINIFTDLGVREIAVVYYFSMFTTNSATIILASGFLWVFNILLPTLVGLFHVKNLKIVTS